MSIDQNCIAKKFQMTNEGIFIVKMCPCILKTPGRSLRPKQASRALTYCIQRKAFGYRLKAFGHRPTSTALKVFVLFDFWQKCVCRGGGTNKEPYF